MLINRKPLGDIARLCVRVIFDAFFVRVRPILGPAPERHGASDLRALESLFEFASQKVSKPRSADQRLVL